MTEACPAPASAVEPPRSGVYPWLAALAGFLCFSRALNFEILTWDDNQLLADPGSLTGFTAANVRWWFTTFRMGHYQPLSWMSYALDMKLGAGDAGVFHLTNVLLHALNAALVTVLFQRIIRRFETLREVADPAALFGGLLFALHPQRVESVAWITQRRDLLASSFLLLCALAYLRAEGRPRRLGWALAAYVAALLAKAGTFPFPVALLVFDFCPLARIRPPAAAGRAATLADVSGCALEKAVFLPFMLPSAWLAAQAQRSALAALDFSQYGLGPRLAQAAYGLCFYPAKFLVPWPLSPWYPLHLPLAVTSAPFVTAMIGAPLLFLLMGLLARRHWASAAGWGAFVILISPVLGILQSGAQLVADHYAYLSTLPFALLAAGLIARGCATRTPRQRLPLLLLAAGWLGTLIWLTSGYLPVWRDSLSFWRYTAGIEAAEPVVQRYWADNVRVQQQQQERIRIRQLLLHDPDDIRLQMQAVRMETSPGGETQAALAILNRALRRQPELSAIALRAHLLTRIDNPAGDRLALRELTRALAVAPENALLRIDRGLLLQKLGRHADAADDYLAAVALQPDNWLTRVSAAAALAHAGRLEQSREQLLQARARVDGQRRRLVEQFIDGEKNLDEAWVLQKTMADS